jgi:hypothetical protein
MQFATWLARLWMWLGALVLLAKHGKRHSLIVLGEWCRHAGQIELNVGDCNERTRSCQKQKSSQRNTAEVGQSSRSRATRALRQSGAGLGAEDELRVLGGFQLVRDPSHSAFVNTRASRSCVSIARWKDLSPKLLGGDV